MSVPEIASAAGGIGAIPNRLRIWTTDTGRRGAETIAAHESVAWAEDHAALAAACEDGVGLCTIVRIDGGFSRRLGAQMAVLTDGTTTGSLADNCLERQLAADLMDARRPAVRRYGKGSPLIDFRLPCGGGLDIMLDPRPDRALCRRVRDQLVARRPAELMLPPNPFLRRRRYLPAIMLNILGNGPEVRALARVAMAAGVRTRALTPGALALGQPPAIPVPDRWTATVLLFHEHEWEMPLLKHALAGDSFFVGAQGGVAVQRQRIERLLADGVLPGDVERVKGPIGLIPSCRDPQSLAVSILAQIMKEYDGQLQRFLS